MSSNNSAETAQITADQLRFRSRRNDFRQQVEAGQITELPPKVITYLLKAAADFDRDDQVRAEDPQLYDTFFN